MARNSHHHNMSLILGSLEDYVPQDHLVRSLEEFIDWDHIYEICDPLYSETGTNRIDPVILFKMMFINIIFGIHSMRRTCEEIKVNIAYRWFLGITMDEKVPDHSTFSQNYIRKFKKDGTALKVFEFVIAGLVDNGLVSPSTVSVDGTHLKANANMNRYENKEVAEAAKRNFYKKSQYKYNEELDAYVCPLGCLLRYSTTNREGRRIYKSDMKQCATCPHRTTRCTESKNGVKVIERHVWQDDLDQSTLLQKNEGRNIYAQRKQTIERAFADGKRRHGLDYTLYTGFESVYDHTILTFAGMNMKKMCTYLKKLRDKYAQSQVFEHQNKEEMEKYGIA